MARDVDEAAVVEAEDPDRKRRRRERAEDVGEAVVAGAELGLPVEAEVDELRGEVAPVADRRHVHARHERLPHDQVRPSFSCFARLLVSFR